MRIKFICLTVIVITLFTLNTQMSKAQDNDNPVVAALGLKAGINLSTLNGQQAYLPDQNGNKIDPTSKLGGVAGAFLYFKFTKQFAIQPELLFSAKGVHFDAGTYVQSWNLWYVEVPVLFKSVFDMQNNVLGSVFAGPALGYNIKSTWDEKLNNTYLHQNTALNNISKFDFSAVLGVSGDMPALGNRLGIDIRYTYGIISLQKNASAENGAISIALYYLFDSGRKPRWEE